MNQQSILNDIHARAHAQAYEVVWETVCACGEHLAVVVLGGEIYPERLYRDVKCNKCGKHYEV